MGDYYDFGIEEINGVSFLTFIYKNKNTNYQEVSVQLSDSQTSLAEAWREKWKQLDEEKTMLIKSFLGI